MLKELKKCLKSEKENIKIFDIILYGSSVKGWLEPHDIDILVIFREGSLKERLGKIQDIKKKLNNKKLDIKGILLEELFKEEFFARSGVIAEGISLFTGDKISRKIGYEGYCLFVYSLKDKKHSEKVKFNYLLSGRNSKGIIKELNGVSLGPGVVKIPIKNSNEFKDILKKHEIKFEKKVILEEI
jgi:predicted nucleotidyltransferase